jgi:carbonic anhydrase/acetyltransferase-like protein (isoleucine patch superfamily)
LEIHPHHGASPEIHPSAWIAPGAHLIGDVHIGEGASVWFGAVLRGDVCSISIGASTNVQDNTVIHVESSRDGQPCNPCIIGAHVTIGHGCIVHGCTIDDYVLVGMGAVVMNRAHIGRECILGAGADFGGEGHPNKIAGDWHPRQGCAGGERARGNLHSLFGAALPGAGAVVPGSGLESLQEIVQKLAGPRRAELAEIGRAEHLAHDVRRPGQQEAVGRDLGAVLGQRIAHHVDVIAHVD